MDTYYAMLDEAINCARQELEALEREEVEAVDALFARREELLTQVWEHSGVLDREILTDKLLQVLALQKELCIKAEELSQQYKEALMANRKQSGYFGGTRYKAAQNEKAVYLSYQT